MFICIESYVFIIRRKLDILAQMEWAKYVYFFLECRNYKYFEPIKTIMYLQLNKSTYKYNLYTISFEISLLNH